MADVDFQGVEVSSGRVLPEWIDINKHMNVAYYVLVFDQGVDALWSRFGMTYDHIREVNSSTFSVESHVMYRQELRLHDPYIVTAQILAYDAKRIHQFQRLYHAEEQFLAATCEWMSLHVDLAARRVAPWPNALLDDIEKVVASQGEWPWPEDAGRQMKISAPIYSARREGDT
ncbi:MAG: thioesterase [Woeseiaceae bacterium]|nr:thioesterase [Woeseiaceae bacterium]NIP21065.1 thioesterase [Woeseiaceae bacterium]NIS90037.1 thioesterase [Woeseiaceae bacterium]